MIEKEVKHFAQSVAHEIIKTAIYARIKGSQYFSKLDMEITFEQYIALDTLSYNPNICQRDLSKLILKDRSNTGRILNILEQNGFIDRVVETKNKRLVKTLSINEKGQKLLDDNEKKIKRDFSKVFDDMTQEEFDTLRALLAKFRHNLSKDTNIQI